MSTAIKQNSKDESKIGVHAPKQPLSGTTVVTAVGVKGFNGISFIRLEETKKTV